MGERVSPTRGHVWGFRDLIRGLGLGLGLLGVK